MVQGSVQFNQEPAFRGVKAAGRKVVMHSQEDIKCTDIVTPMTFEQVAVWHEKGLPDRGNVIATMFASKHQVVRLGHSYQLMMLIRKSM